MAGGGIAVSIALSILYEKATGSVINRMFLPGILPNELGIKKMLGSLAGVAVGEIASTIYHFSKIEQALVLTLGAAVGSLAVGIIERRIKNFCS